MSAAAGGSGGEPGGDGGAGDPGQRNVSAWAIRNPVPVVLLFVVLTVLGLFSFARLPVTLFPNIDVPFVTVTVADPGAAPSEVASGVAEPLESALFSLSGVNRVSSTSTLGAATVTVEFEIGVDSQRALEDVKDAVARARGDLPASAEEPVVQRLDVTGLPILFFAVEAPDMPVEELSWFVDDTLAREIQSVPGVGRIDRIGGAAREIAVSLDPARIAALGLTAADVSQALAAANADATGGRAALGGQEQTIRALAQARTVEGLAGLTLTLPGGRELRLSDVATVRDGAAEPRTFARVDGRPAVAFAVTRATGASDVAVAERVRARAAEIAASRPGLSIREIDNSVDQTHGTFVSAMETLIEGAALAVIVVLLFLRDWRATLIAATALPLSIIPTFLVMDALGFSLNTVSLLAVTLVTGILVDDAIVEIENVVRHGAMGKPPRRAAFDASAEIGLAVIAISVTIMAVFAPVSFMGGIAGQYFRQFGLTVAVAVFFSLMVARLVTPLMAAWFMRPHHHGEARDGVLMRGYLRAIRWILRHRLVTMIGGVAIVAGSVWLAAQLPTGFLPAEDNARSVFLVELPPGAELGDTAATAADVSARIAARPEVTSVFVQGGAGPTGGLAVRQATVTVRYVPKGEREMSQADLEAAIAADLRAVPDIRLTTVQDNGARAFSIALTGEDADAVARAAEAVAGDLGGVPLLANVTTTAALQQPELQVIPDLQRAAGLGISPAAIARTVRVATLGDFDQALPRFGAGDRRIPVRVALPPEDRGDLDVLRGLRVPTASGGSVPLAAVAELRFGGGPAAVERLDGRYRVAVEADLVGGAPLGPALEAANATPTLSALPPGVALETSGDAEIMGEVFASFGQALGAGVLMVYAVLVLLFGSFLLPMAIMLTLPLSVGGAMIALWVADMPISLPVVIGILMLFGIVTKNAIMLVDFALMEREKGRSAREAIAEAGHKRARPIVMTTIAMVAGMIPSALALGEGGDFRAPMAVAVIGGLIFSTFLSLLFTPAFYSLVEGGGRRVGSLLRRLLPPEARAEPAE